MIQWKIRCFENVKSRAPWWVCNWHWPLVFPSSLFFANLNVLFSFWSSTLCVIWLISCFKVIRIGSNTKCWRKRFLPREDQYLSCIELALHINSKSVRQTNWCATMKIGGLLGSLQQAECAVTFWSPFISGRFQGNPQRLGIQYQPLCISVYTVSVLPKCWTIPLSLIFLHLFEMTWLQSKKTGKYRTKM